MKIHRLFLYEQIIPYLTEELGFKRIPKYPYRRTNNGSGLFYFYMKDDIVIIMAKRTYNRLAYFIVTQATKESYKLIGTIAYEMVFPEYFKYMFAGDLFEILNKDYYGTIEFVGLKDYYKTKGYEYPIYRALTLQRGDNPFSRRCFPTFESWRQGSV